MGICILNVMLQLGLCGEIINVAAQLFLREQKRIILQNNSIKNNSLEEYL